MKTLLKFEGFSMLVLTCFLFYKLDYNWILFAVLFMAPDLAILCYKVNVKFGSECYNFIHNYILHATLIALGILLNVVPLIEIGMIFFAHSSMDRALGYGLKYNTFFLDTHMQHI